MSETKYRLGIDIGSTTVKVALIDDNLKVLFSDYQRHYANIHDIIPQRKKKDSRKILQKCV